MCFLGFASVRNFGHTRLRHPCLACPSRCTNPCLSHNRCKRTIIPSPRTTSLPPLSKGGGLTARHKLLLYCVLLATQPPFLFTKSFCRQDGGIAAPSPSKTALSLSLFVGRGACPSRNIIVIIKNNSKEI